MVEKSSRRNAREDKTLCRLSGESFHMSGVNCAYDGAVGRWKFIVWKARGNLQEGECGKCAGACKEEWEKGI